MFPSDRRTAGPGPGQSGDGSAAEQSGKEHEAGGVRVNYDMSHDMAAGVKTSVFSYFLNCKSRCNPLDSSPLGV